MKEGESMAEVAAAGKADWYFDFISPYSYLQFAMFDRLPAGLDVTLKPVLFAGLLNRFGHLGPAEIPAKRRHMYRFCTWFADRNGIPFKLPAAHPFNPLRPLRLAVALGATRPVVKSIFDFVWAEGHDPSDDRGWRLLTERLDLADPDTLIGDPSVKASLRENTEQAASRGVFGVPTFVIADELFWGVDSTEMLLDYLADPSRFATGEMARANSLPVGAVRRK